MKKNIVLGLVVVVAFAVVACGGGGNKSKTQVWKLAFNQSAEHPQARGMQCLPDKFYEATNGAYRIEVIQMTLGQSKRFF